MPEHVKNDLNKLCDNNTAVTDKFFCNGNVVSYFYANIEYVHRRDLNSTSFVRALTGPLQGEWVRVRAMTLFDIIVFRERGDALNNTCLWLHELKHVQQFRARGRTKFCRQYIGDGCNSYNSEGCPIEAPAYDIQGKCKMAGF